MGYTTDFKGSFEISPALTSAQQEEFESMFDGDQRVSQDYGDKRRRVPWAPGYYCQWVVGGDGSRLEWDESEKFYNYVEWLKGLIANYFTPLGVEIAGDVIWQGEEVGDAGRIRIKDGVVTTVSLSEMLG